MLKFKTKIAIITTSLFLINSTGHSQTTRVVEESRETIEFSDTEGLFKCHEGVPGGYGATTLSISGWKFPRRVASNHDSFSKILVYPSSGSGNECAEALESLNTQISENEGVVKASVHRTVSKVKLPSAEDQNYFCVLNLVDKTTVDLLDHQLTAIKTFRMKEVPLSECGL